MRKIILLLSLSTIVLLFNSCDPSENNSSDANFSENFGASVSRDFIGQVVDAENHPIQGVTVKIGTTSVQTDINGVFIINDAFVHEKFAYITAKKAGYIDGSRSMVPTSGKNNVRIMLLQDTPLQTIQSGVTSEVSIYSGTKVTFDGAFVDENGNAYSGAVAVSMFHLTPSDANIDKLMPGMLYAQNENGQAGVLETFGMLHVELKGSNGQKLQIATGHTAQITMRIDDSQLATCPSTIPLWHFDEENGYWKQEGSATKNGNYYVGNVSHFSWWNCDAFSNSGSLTITILDSNGNPLQNVGIGLIVNNLNMSSYVLNTDNNGQVSGLIPINKLMTLNVYDVCGNIIYTSQIGPYSSNKILEPIVISNSVIQLTKVSGRFIKCDDSEIENGYVLYKYHDITFFSNLTNSTYNFNALVCNDSNQFEIEGFDFDNNQSTGLINYSFSFPETHIVDLKACNSITEFISFKVNGEPQIIVDNISLSTQSESSLNCFTPKFHIDTNTYFGIITSGNQIGNYGMNNSKIWFKNINGSIYYTLVACQDGSIINKNVTINKIGGVGDYVDITFSGTGIYTPNTNVTITGLAHILRDN